MSTDETRFRSIEDIRSHWENINADSTFEPKQKSNRDQDEKKKQKPLVAPKPMRLMPGFSEMTVSFDSSDRSSANSTTPLLRETGLTPPTPPVPRIKTPLYDLPSSNNLLLDPSVNNSAYGNIPVPPKSRSQSHDSGIDTKTGANKSMSTANSYFAKARAPSHDGCMTMFESVSSAPRSPKPPPPRSATPITHKSVMTVLDHSRPPPAPLPRKTTPVPSINDSSPNNPRSLSQSSSHFVQPEFNNQEAPRLPIRPSISIKERSEIQESLLPPFQPTFPTTSSKEPLEVIDHTPSPPRPTRPTESLLASKERIEVIEHTPPPKPIRPTESLLASKERIEVIENTSPPKPTRPTESLLASKKRIEVIEHIPPPKPIRPTESSLASKERVEVIENAPPPKPTRPISSLLNSKEQIEVMEHALPPQPSRPASLPQTIPTQPVKIQDKNETSSATHQSQHSLAAKSSLHFISSFKDQEESKISLSQPSSISSLAQSTNRLSENEDLIAPLHPLWPSISPITSKSLPSFVSTEESLPLSLPGRASHHEGVVSQTYVPSTDSRDKPSGLLHPPTLPPRISRSVSPSDERRLSLAGSGSSFNTTTSSLYTSQSQSPYSTTLGTPYGMPSTPPFINGDTSDSHSSGLSTPIIPSTSEAEVSDSDDGSNAAMLSMTSHPDSSQVNRRAPIFEGVLHEIPCKGDVKSVEVYGNLACIASSTSTRIMDIQNGNEIWSMTDFKVTAVGFLPNKKMWLGTKEGQIIEISSQSPNDMGPKRSNVHMTALVAIGVFSYCIWTLSEDGKICIWKNGDLTAMPKTYRVTPSFKASCISTNRLWVGKNRQVFVYHPSLASDVSFLLTPRAIQAPASAKAMVGDFTCSTSLKSFPDYVYFGHEDGTISIFSQTKLASIENVPVSINKVTALCGVGKHLWIGLKTGSILVCDVTQRPWKATKEWKAHDGPILNITCHEEGLSSCKNILAVASYSLDNTVRLWDGLLKHDWIEYDMHQSDREFSSFRDIFVRIITWNAGAAKPSDLDRSSTDKEFLQKALMNSDTEPHVIVFGFQEIVELDKTSVTAKTMLRGKRKKDVSQVAVSAHISHQYKAWQDRLCDGVNKTLKSPYKLIHSNNMVGLFTCVFLRESELPNLRGIRSSSVKTGLGGLHGNKGGLVVRMLLEDSSLCFVNSHLAAGQSGSLQRNRDIEMILETQFLDESENAKYTGKGIFVNGGDGTMILDHETVFFSGDMNYRINMLRPIAIKAIEENNFQKLLEADQLSLQFKKYPGLRLRPFSEAAIEFKPTYKFDVGTDNYDSSEKKRVPAWCDRIFYRGGDNGVIPLSYNSETLRVSDHRPVNGLFKVQIKTIERQKRNESYKNCLIRWDNYLKEKVDALIHLNGD